MGDRIHDDEVDTSEATVRALLCDQLPAWADAPVTRLGGTGTTNALWRVHGDPTDIVVRLPRMAGGAGGIDTEVALLPHLASTPLADMIRVPRLIHSGSPSTAYPLRWMAAQWLAGDDLWSLRDRPATMAIVGAGAIGCELSQALARLGVRVCVRCSPPHPPLWWTLITSRRSTRILVTMPETW